MDPTITTTTDPTIGDDIHVKRDRIEVGPYRWLWNLMDHTRDKPT
jgi:hypothetical protein